MNNEEKNRALSAIEAIEAEAVRLGVKINLADLKCEIKSPSDGLAYISTHYAKVSIPAWGKVADVHIDLFAGAGGLAIGLERAGFSPTAMYEKDKYACKTLRRNITSDAPTLQGTVEETDVADVEWQPGRQPVRLLAAGAPCQPFSLGFHIKPRR